MYGAVVVTLAGGGGGRREQREQLSIELTCLKTNVILEGMCAVIICLININIVFFCHNLGYNNFGIQCTFAFSKL